MRQEMTEYVNVELSGGSCMRRLRSIHIKKMKVELSFSAAKVCLWQSFFFFTKYHVMYNLLSRHMRTNTLLTVLRTCSCQRGFSASPEYTAVLNLSEGFFLLCLYFLCGVLVYFILDNIGWQY